jgi:hypothetical protein
VKGLEESFMLSIALSPSIQNTAGRRELLLAKSSTQGQEVILYAVVAAKIDLRSGGTSKPTA